MVWTPPKKSRLSSLRSRFRKKKPAAESPEESLERFVDMGLGEIIEARDFQDWMDASRGPPPDEPPEDHQTRMLEMDTDKEIDKLQGLSLLLLFKSSKRLERQSDQLTFLTYVLGVLTVVLIVVSLIPR